MASVHRLPTASDQPAESALLRQQLSRVQDAFYDDRTRATDLKALSVEMRELRALIKAAEANENKTLTIVADTDDEPFS
jgi:hypothetical protein